MTQNVTTNNNFLKTYQSILVQRVEKVVTAMYLVTSLMVDQEPLKWQIRDLSLEALNLSHKGMINRLANSIEDLISLVSLSGRSALVSQMNVELLDRGLRGLLDFIKNQEMFDDEFLGLNEPKRPILPVKDKKDTYKRQDNNVLYKGQTSVRKEGSGRKHKRRELIIEALKKKSNSSIKDIARLVKGCSEKTIQRELNSLISDGLISKKGERRWSVYLLN